MIRRGQTIEPGDEFDCSPLELRNMLQKGHAEIATVPDGSAETSSQPETASLEPSETAVKPKAKAKAKAK